MNGTRRILLNPIVGVVGPDGNEIPAGSVTDVPAWFAVGLLLDGRATEAPPEPPPSEVPPNDAPPETPEKKGKK